MSTHIKFLKKIILIIFILILFFFGYQRYISSKRKPQTPPPTPAIVQEIKKTDVYPKMSFVTKIQSENSVGLRARVSGFLEKRLFEEGDIVSVGQPLFLIEQANFKSTVSEAKANYEKALAVAQNASAQYNRFKSLIKTKDVSASRLDDAKAAEKTALATVDQTKASLALAEKDLEYTEVKAPLTGKIREAKFKVGELVGPESGLIAEIVQIDPIESVFSVSENELLQLQKRFSEEKQVRVQFLNSEGILYEKEGSISFIDAVLDENMNTLKLKALFPNSDNQLISGQYGKIVLTATIPEKSIIIPLQSIQRDMTGSFVYVVTPQNTVEKRSIETGSELDDFNVVVSKGLNSGEKIITEGFQKILPNMTVTPVLKK